MKRTLQLLFWAFVLLAMSGQIAGAEDLANTPYLPSPGDDAGGMGEGFPWHYAVGAMIALALIWFLG